MPRKPRIEISGYYHIINRGVEQRTIFKEANDYEYFKFWLKLGKYMRLNKKLKELMLSSNDNKE